MRGVLRLRFLAAFVLVVSALTIVPSAYAAALSVEGTDPVVADMNDTIAVAAGWASPGATVNLTVSDGVPADDVTESATAGGNGAWMIQNLNLSSLNEGAITYHAASGVDTASYVAAKNAAALVYIDSATNPVTNTTKTQVSVTGCAEPAQTVNLIISDGTNTVAYSAAADGSTLHCPTGAWSFTNKTVVGLTDGPITYTVTSNGHTAMFPALLDTSTTVSITTWPHPYIIPSNQNPATVSGTAELGDTIALLVSDGTPSDNVTDSTSVDGSGNWSFSSLDLHGLNEGTNNITIRATATDRVGNTAIDTKTVSKDTVDPSAPVISDYTGKGGADGSYINIGNVGSVTINGTADNNAKIELDVTDGDGNHVTPAVVYANGSGAWSFTPFSLSSLTDGFLNVVYSVRATDAAGNHSSWVSTSPGITKDTVAPGAPVISDYTGKTGGWINVSNVNSVSISGTTNVSGAKIHLDVSDGHGNHVIPTDIYASGTSWSFTGLSLSTLLDSTGSPSIVYTVTATDAANNTGSPTSTTALSKDTSTPGAPVVLNYTGKATGWINDANKTSVAINGTAEAGATITLDISDGANDIVRTALATGGSWSFTGIDVSTLNEGVNNITYYVHATDPAGNQGDDASPLPIVSKDTVAPSAPAILGHTDPVNVASSGHASINGTAEPGATINLDIADTHGHHVAGTTTATGGSWSFTNENVSGLTDGTITYHVTATDAAGNMSPEASPVPATKDTVAPAPPVVNGPNTINIANVGSVTISGTAESGATIHLDAHDNSGHHVMDTTTATGGTWTFTKNLSGLSDGVGTITYSVTATDASSNTSTPGTKSGVTKDTSAPAAPVISTYTHPYINIANKGAVTISGTAEAGATINLDIADTHGHHVAGTTTATGGSWSFTKDVSSLEDGVGNITYTVRAVDPSGNQSSPNSTSPGVTKDTGAPTAPVISTYTNPINGLNVHSVSISGTADSDVRIDLDISDGVHHVTGTMSAPASSWSFTKDVSTLSDGVNGVTYSVKATDAAGNSTTSTRTVTKNVTVKTVPAPPTGAAAVKGRGAATISWTPPTYTGNDTIDHYTVTSSSGAFTCTATGATTTSCRIEGLTGGTPYTFTVTAHNPEGNSAPSVPSAAVTPDAATVPDAPTGVTGYGLESGAVISWTAPPDDGGRPITRYTVTAAAGGVPVPGGTCSTTGSPPATTCTVAGLSNEVGYTFTVTATNAIGTSDPSTASRTIVPHKGNTYFATTPSRVLNTIALGTPLSANAGITFHVTGQSGVPAKNVPSNASAVTGVLTIVAATYRGFAALVPVLVPPTTSSINFGTGDTISTGVTIPLGAGGTLGLTYAAPDGNTANAYFDVTGYFVAGTSGSTYVTITPSRILDTRPTGAGHTNRGLAGKFENGVPRTFQITGNLGALGTVVPTWATAVTGNVTLTNQSTAGHVTVGPDPEASPTTATIYSPSWPVTKDNRATAITVKLGTGGTLSATWTGAAASTADLIFDVNGYFVAGLSGAMYVPLTPNRILDTRSKLGLSRNLISHRGAAFTVVNRVTSDATKNVPSTAVAVTGTLTVTRQQMLGWLALTPTAQNNPTTSTLNFLMENRATGVTVPLGGGKLGICYGAGTSKTSDAIFDVTGYFIP